MQNAIIVINETYKAPISGVPMVRYAMTIPNENDEGSTPYYGTAIVGEPFEVPPKKCAECSGPNVCWDHCDEDYEE